MAINISLMILFGVLSILFVFITMGIGLAITYFRKPYLKIHKIVAGITILLVIIHAILAFLYFFYGKII